MAHRHVSRPFVSQRQPAEVVLQHFINGKWIDSICDSLYHDVVDPSTEEKYSLIQLGGAEDASAAVEAASSAFPAFAMTSLATRIELLRAVHKEYVARANELAHAISWEMGAPIAFSKAAQVQSGADHLLATIEAAQSLPLEESVGTAAVMYEPVGVCSLITPWNWPMNQIACKVAPALAAGCTVVLKPSEYAPFSASIFAEAVEAAGVPPGVFNLLHGSGDAVGRTLSAHPLVDMVSFTGSTRAGVCVAKDAAHTVKRVCQELGGKSPNIIMDDLSTTDFRSAVFDGATLCFSNSGQSCDAPTRMLVPASRLDEAKEAAREAASSLTTGAPFSSASLGPLVNRLQWDRVQALIKKGVAEGAELVAGGEGRPAGLDRGYFVKPTVFSGVTPEMTIAREEIFGPVLSIIPYVDDAEALSIANGTPYGLAAYISGSDPVRVRHMVARLRAGNVYCNSAEGDINAPFGGYKQSGNGREWGKYGIHEFLEVKAVVGLP